MFNIQCSILIAVSCVNMMRDAATNRLKQPSHVYRNNYRLLFTPATVLL